MNNTLIENIKIKSDLQYDFLLESKEYHALDSENKIFLKECYDMGVNQSIYLHQQDKALLESIDEGLWDRFKAGAARVGQGLKNVSGIGTPTADSKDAGVDSLLNSFKTKWAKAPKAQTPPASGNNPIIAPIVNNVNQNIAQIASASATSTTPPPTPQQANVIVQQSNAPISLKTKIANLIRANPKKTKFLLGVLSFGAGVAAAAATAGNPIAAKVAAGLVNGLGNVAIAKIQGGGASDQLMAGLGGGLAGTALGTAGASALSGISSLFSNAATNAVDATTDGFADTSDGNSPEVQVTQQQSAVSPEDQSLPDTEAPDTNQYDAQGNRIDPQQQFADTSDANSPEVQATQQQVANTPQGAAQPRFKSALDPRSARVAFDRSRGVIKEEKMFVKSYNNTYTLKKSLNENIEEKWNEGYEETIDEALNTQQQQAYDEFLTDLGKMFNKPKDGVVAFMQSQGDRFKNVLDYLNQNVTPTTSPQQSTPDQEPGQQPQGQVKPSLVKHINGIKGSALFAGDLAARIQKVIDFTFDQEDPSKNIRPMIGLRSFLKSLNGTLNTNSANFRKQIGDPSALLQQVNEDFKQFNDLLKQISAVMPSIVGATFELRQMFGVRKPQAPGGGAPKGSVPPVISEEDQAKSNLSVEELTRSKFFLSKLVDIGLLVKSIDANQGDKVQLKNLYMNLLQLANIVVNKNVKGIKLNKKIDSVFQGKDILGPNAVNKKENPVKKGPGDIFKEGKKNNFKLR